MSDLSVPMQPLSPAIRIEQALAAAAPAEALFNVARELRDEGIAQAQLLALFDLFRHQHASDVDETRYDAIVDTMDFIVGYCSPSHALYPNGN